MTNVGIALWIISILQWIRWKLQSKKRDGRVHCLDYDFKASSTSTASSNFSTKRNTYSTLTQTLHSSNQRCSSKLSIGSQIYLSQQYILTETYLNVLLFILLCDETPFSMSAKSFVCFLLFLLEMLILVLQLCTYPLYVWNCYFCILNLASFIL